MNTRIIGIDIARGFAILLVTWKHSMASFGARGILDGWAHYSLEILMQFATPIFLILFGAMLELVYRPRFERGFQHHTSRRLYKRALQCYGYYALAIIVFFSVKGIYSWMSLPLVFSGFVSVPYSHLLGFYTAALAIAPALITARVRFGIGPLICLALLVHLAHPVFLQLPPAPELFGRDYLQHMSGFLYGQGVDFIGPSLVHGLSLVCFGMLFGYGLKPTQTATGKVWMSVRVSLIIASVCLATIVVCFNWQSPFDSLQNLVGAELRISSHPLYFSIGVLGAIFVTWVFILLVDVLKTNIGRSLQVFGRRSLFAFGIGNILAFIAPVEMVEMFGLWGSVLSLFLFVCGLTLAYDQVEKHQIFKRLFCRFSLIRWELHKTAK